MGVVHDNLGKWISFCSYVFSNCNGKINPVLHAVNLRFGNPARGRKSTIFGSSNVDEVIINILDIADYCERNGIEDETIIKSVFLFTVLHELSHCDQDIDFVLAKKDRRETLKYEMENDINTLVFITKNFEYLTNLVGPFQCSIMKSIMHQSSKILFSDLSYKPIQSVPQKIIRILSGLIEERIEDTLEDKTYHTLMVEYHRANQNITNQTLMRNHCWIPIQLNLLREISCNTRILVHVYKNPEKGSVMIHIIQNEMSLIEPMYIDYRRLKKA